MVNLVEYTLPMVGVAVYWQLAPVLIYVGIVNVNVNVNVNLNTR